MSVKNKHAEACICGSADIVVVRPINSHVHASKITCESCGYSVHYRLTDGHRSARTVGEVMEQLLSLWNEELLNVKLEQQLALTEASYFKEEMVTSLIQLSTLIETAAKEDLTVSDRTKARIKKTMAMIQLIIPALAGLEQASLSYFNAALSELKACKSSIEFQPLKAVKVS